MRKQLKSTLSANTQSKRWRIAFITSMAIISICWIMLYNAHHAAPPPLGTHAGDGWWGWFDQDQYLKITEQFAVGDYFNPNKYYPPLYPAIPALISNIVSTTGAYLAVDLMLCLVFFGGLFLNFRTYLNPLISLVSVILMYGVTSITYEQWVIPWTTNLSSTLLILISLLLGTEFKKNHHYPTWSNWRTSAAFFLTGLMVWVRPFEIIPASILCLGLLITQVTQVLSNNQPGTSSQTALRLSKIVIVPFITLSGTILVYALYNLKTFGSWEPSYSKTINNMGFSPWDLGFKFISLATDSNTYGISNGHLSHYLPLFIPLTLLGIISLIFLAFPQQILVISAIINFTSYLSFNDLVPTGLFTFNNIHYFTWSLAVIGISAVATLKIVIETSIKKPKFRRIQLPALAGCWALAMIVIIHLEPSTNAITISTSKPKIICPSKQTEASNIRTKAAQYQLNFRQINSKKSNITRLLEINIETKSNPTQVHLAHQDQISLILNDKELTYRKNWRLVNREEDQNNKLSILLHEPIAANHLSGMLTIGQQSNIELSNLDFDESNCNYNKKILQNKSKY